MEKHLQMVMWQLARVSSDGESLTSGLRLTIMHWRAKLIQNTAIAMAWYYLRGIAVAKSCKGPVVRR